MEKNKLYLAAAKRKHLPKKKYNAYLLNPAKLARPIRKVE